MPDPDDLALRRSIIDACLAMNALGLNRGTSGNISARTPSGFLISPSGRPYTSLTPDQIVPMDLDGGYTGPVLPSSEWRMHMDIYKSRPEARAVVHAHSTCSVYATFGSAELSAAMLEAIRDRQACLLANHGQICFGPSVEKALWLAGEVEGLCEQYFVACRAGGPVLLTDAEMGAALERWRAYVALEEVEGGPIRRDAPVGQARGRGWGRKGYAPIPSDEDTVDGGGSSGRREGGGGEGEGS
eukprot:evm.model.scf_1577.1 EVM.evm.TU.scf_1577.1   scf_1577:5810-7192(-)